MGLSAPETPWRGSARFTLGDDSFTLMPRLVINPTAEENYRISRGWMVVENALGILPDRFMVLLGTIEQRPKVVRNIVLTYFVLHNMLRTHQSGIDRTPTPADDIAFIENEPVVYVPDDNHSNPLGRQIISETY